MLLNLPQAVFLGQFQVLLRYKAALPCHGVDVSISFQLLIGPLGGDDADTQVPGQSPDGWERLPRPELSRGNSPLDLAADLLINRQAAGIADDDIQCLAPFCICTVYTVITVCQEGKMLFEDIWCTDNGPTFLFSWNLLSFL